MSVTLEEIDKKLDKVVFQQERLADAQVAQNGRIGRLEDWQHKKEVADAEERGRKSASADTVVSMRMVTTVGAVLGVVGAAMTLILRFWGP